MLAALQHLLHDHCILVIGLGAGLGGQVLSLLQVPLAVVLYKLSFGHGMTLSRRLLQPPDSFLLVARHTHAPVVEHTHLALCPVVALLSGQAVISNSLMQIL